MDEAVLDPTTPTKAPSFALSFTGEKKKELDYEVAELRGI